MTQSMPTNITILGDGGWGTTLALYFQRAGHQVTLWGAFADYVEQMRRSRYNVKFLPDIPLPDQVLLTADLAQAMDASDIIIVAIPSQYMRSTLATIRQAADIKKHFICATKGMEENTFLRPSEIIHDIFPQSRVAAFSGPTIAGEIALGMPAAAIIAHADEAEGAFLQSLFLDRSFRVYSSTDVIGVELGGAVKNIIAIACGISDGLGFKSNTKSALMTRALAEIIRLGTYAGAQQATFYGLSGLGDMITTCMSPVSRNRTFGERLGKGERKVNILAGMNQVVEGVETVKAVYQLAQAKAIDMPITEQVYYVLYHDRSPHEAVSELLARQVKPE